MRELVAGDLVTAKFQPSLGVGVVEYSICGRVGVVFEADGVYQSEFDEAELVRARPKVTRTA